MIFARLKGIRYAHSPLTSVAHDPPEVGPMEWSQRWEDFFSLGEGEISSSQLEGLGLRLRPTRKLKFFIPRSRSIHVVPHCHKITDLHPGAWSAIAPVLRQKYDLRPKPRLPGEGDPRLQIAIHVRRGDVGASGRFSERFTPDSVLLSRLRRVIEIFGRDRVVIRLFSEGNPRDFQPYSDLGINLHLNEDIFVGFHHFVKSDILFTAKSSLSYLGGVIGGNLCIHEEICHPTLPGWFKAEEVESPNFADRLRQAVQMRNPESACLPR
ncbi:MAG: hypothetical protein MUF31_18360 [Akkermansiaceae bacterium]|jgi:hypothetical protein|nr:hypothetical protein [Akkermansiaceae bacterium]